MEIQTRSPFSDLLTPQNCRQRYLDLRRRFESGGESIEEDAGGGGGGGESGSPADVPWLEELRKIRMAELRREVDRYDVSITSLQLKLKNLRAERERSEAGEREPDLKDKETNKEDESPGPGPDAFPRDLNSVGNSGGSCKESNSTDLKDKDVNPSGGGASTEPEKTPEAGGQDAMALPAHEASYNGSSETLSKGSETAEGGPLLLGESGESVAGEAAGEKESSDVQSSASLSRRKRRFQGKRRKAISGSSSVAEEAETDPFSTVAVNVKRSATVESHPLAAFLEIIRSSKYGSFFVRRLEGQESSRYRCVIRRHVDLEIVRSRLERKGAKYSTAEFFRDLLLLCNNAIVFFPKESPESTAAVILRQMVSKEMAVILPKPAKNLREEVAKEPSLPLPKVFSKIKLDTDLSNPLPKKNRSSGSLIACRKRSSISKAPATSDAEVAVKEAREYDSDSDHREHEQDVDKHSAIAKPKTRERSKVLGARGLRTNKSRGGPGLRNSKSAPALKLSPMADEIPEFPSKIEKKDVAHASNQTPKKKNAASFLNRLKGNSTSSSVTGTLLNSLKSSGGGSVGKGLEPKRGGKGEGRKEATAATSPESIPPTKRSVGRPPKKMAPTPTPSPPPPKRTKVDSAPAKRPPAPPQKKRGRK